MLAYHSGQVNLIRTRRTTDSPSKSFQQNKSINSPDLVSVQPEKSPYLLTLTSVA